MISKQASTLPRRLIRRYRSSDPFELADALNITVLERGDFKRQKGAGLFLTRTYVWLWWFWRWAITRTNKLTVRFSIDRLKKSILSKIKSRS